MLRQPPYKPQIVTKKFLIVQWAEPRGRKRKWETEGSRGETGEAVRRRGREHGLVLRAPGHRSRGSSTGGRAEIRISGISASDL